MKKEGLGSAYSCRISYVEGGLEEGLVGCWSARTVVLYQVTWEDEFMEVVDVDMRKSDTQEPLSVLDRARHSNR